MTDLPTQRNLDTMFIRVQDSNGRWESRALTDVPFPLVAKWLSENGANRFAIEVIRHLHEQLRKLGDQFDIVGTETFSVETAADAFAILSKLSRDKP